MSIKTIYKIKSDAINFFPSFYSDLIKEKDFWEQHHVPMEALEKVEAPLITYGQIQEVPICHQELLTTLFIEITNPSFISPFICLKYRLKKLTT